MAQFATVTQAYFELPERKLAFVSQAYFELPRIRVANVTSAYFELPHRGHHGKPHRRWRSRLYGQRREDLQNLPLVDRKNLARSIKTALDSLTIDVVPGVSARARNIQEMLLRADSSKRKSLLRVAYEVYLDHLEEVLWVFDAHEEQRKRRTREDDEILFILSAARGNLWQ